MIFQSANILLPNKTVQPDKWAVIACDQFSAQPEYWQRVRSFAAGAPSAVNLILPECDLEGDYSGKVATINDTMLTYMEQKIFEEYKDAFIYVERTLLSGKIRRGVVGAVDLEAYDYTPGSQSGVRATEKTVLERIPPRQRIRENASLELPHVLLLCDDPEQQLLGSIHVDSLPVVYDFDLMEGGGHITGRLIQGADADRFRVAIDAYEASCQVKFAPNSPVYYAVGDGNHSLATAKSCFEAAKAANPGKDFSCHPARYALVELENIHDESQEFEPIHRVIFHTDPDKILREMEQQIGSSTGEPIRWYSGSRSGEIRLKLAPGQLCIAAVQAFLDDYLSHNPGEIDYIHGDEDTRQLSAAEDAIGFLLPAIHKSGLFPGIIADGVLPRKTFSMGHAQEKRYYMEAHQIR